MTRSAPSARAVWLHGVAKVESTTDHETLAELGTELATAQSALDDLEEQWMEVSLALEGA